MCYIFRYLKNSLRKKIYFDPDYLNKSEGRFYKYNWEDFYQDAKEDMQYNISKPLGRAIKIYRY